MKKELKKYRLKCFRCITSFKLKEEVFRNHEGYPICKDCLWESLYDKWEDNYLEYIIEEIEKRFNRNYNKWHKWFYKNHILCDGEHDDYSNYCYYYEHKDNITVIDGKNYCTRCVDEMAVFIETIPKEVV